MQRTVLAVCILTMCAFLAACDVSIDIDSDNDNDNEDVDGSGDIVVEDRTVDDFDRIVLAGEGNVIIEEGPTSLSIETDDNLMTHIETTVSGDVLTIETEEGIDIDPTDSVTYRISTPAVVGVTLAGAGSFDLQTWEVDDFTIVVAGAGDIDIERLTANSVDVTVAGVGQITIAGETTELNVSLSGAGDFEGGDLMSEKATVITSGAGSATVWATGDLEATVSGVGNIDYFGVPRVSQTVTGVGSISSRGEK